MQERMYQSLQHHPAFRAATPDDRWAMSTCLSSACLPRHGQDVDLRGT
jgi:hypothetical protein